MNLIFKLHLKEYFKIPSNTAYTAIILLFCAVVLPFVSEKNFYISVPVIVLSFSSQIVSSAFIDEKENRRLETLISLPLNMRYILSGKVLFCFAIGAVIFLISAPIGGLIYMFTEHIEFTSYLVSFVFSYLLIVLITLYNSVRTSAYIVLNTIDSTACTLSVVFNSLLHGIVSLGFILTMSALKEILVVILAFMVLNLTEFVISGFVIKKFHNKTNVMDYFRS